MPDFRVERESVTFWLKVKPRSEHKRLAWDSSGELCLQLHAPPTEGQANDACVVFLARALRVPQVCVAILAGKKSRRKLIRVTGHSAEETIEVLKKLAGKNR